MEHEISQQPMIKERKPRQVKESKIMILDQRVGKLESIHPELKPKKTPLYMIIIKWLFFLIIAGIFLYSIYLFYCYDQLGKDIIIPFWGILRH